MNNSAQIGLQGVSEWLIGRENRNNPAFESIVLILWRNEATGPVETRKSHPPGCSEPTEDAALVSSIFRHSQDIGPTHPIRHPGRRAGTSVII